MTIMVGELVLLFSGNLRSPSTLSSSDYHGPRGTGLARQPVRILDAISIFFSAIPLFD